MLVNYFWYYLAKETVYCIFSVSIYMSVLNTEVVILIIELGHFTFSTDSFLRGEMLPLGTKVGSCCCPCVVLMSVFVVYSQFL